jgi:hypothetical protein
MSCCSAANLARPRDRRSIIPAPGGIAAGIDDRSPRIWCASGLGPEKGVIDEAILKTLAPAGDGHDGNGKNGIEVLAVHRVEAALLKRSQRQESRSGLARKSRRRRVQERGGKLFGAF